MLYTYILIYLKQICLCPAQWILPSESIHSRILSHTSLYILNTGWIEWKIVFFFIAFGLKIVHCIQFFFVVAYKTGNTSHASKMIYIEVYTNITHTTLHTHCLGCWTHQKVVPIFHNDKKPIKKKNRHTHKISSAQ